MRIEQALHGYADGHRLLAGSVELSRTAQYLMLGLSDMSGRSMVPGFEEYLTAYPIPEAGLYAFAKTWNAPEMERPGCVWTHTLLIHEKELGAIQDLGGLRHLFRRPSARVENSSWDEYRAPVEFAERGQDPTVVQPLLEQAVALALWGLYGIPDLPVFYPAEDALQLEDMLVAIWSQQWPRLRYSFRFCTGAIGVRTSGGQAFDFQVVPLASIREVRREVPASTLVASGGWKAPVESADWVMRACEDLLGRGESAFRQFLRKHASEDFDGRTAFAPLVEFFPILEEKPTGGGFMRLLEVIGRRYPEPKNAAMLKRAVAAKGFPLGRSLVPGTSECDVLRALATTGAGSAFDPESLVVEERARSLWENDSTGAEALISFLIGNDLNSIGERVLLSLIRSMSIEDAIRHSDAIPGLVATVVRINPDVATSPIVWRGQHDHQRGLFDAATANREVSTDIQRSMVLAMLQAGSDAAAERAVRKFGAVAVDAVMTWFDESGCCSPWDLHDGWRRALSPQTSALLTWLADRQDVHEATCALIADLSDPHSAEVRARGTDIWLKTLSNHEPQAPAKARTRLYTFLLALGFDSPAGRPDELVARTFDVVHAALADDQLGEESWFWLDEHLPTLAIWRNWDRCERLRRGLVERFVAHGWPIPQLFRCAQDSDTLNGLLKSCGKVEGGNLLLKRIKRAIADDEIQLDRKRREVVEWYVE